MWPALKSYTSNIIQKEEDVFMYLGIHIGISTIKETEVMNLRDSRDLWGRD